MGPTVAAAHSACSSRLELVEEVASRPSSSASLTNMQFHPSLPKLSILFDHENAVVSAKVLLNHFRPELHNQLKNEELILEVRYICLTFFTHLTINLLAHINISLKFFLYLRQLKNLAARAKKPERIEMESS
jgi:hypothetical protein